MLTDHVVCTNCGSEMIVTIGLEACPICKKNGSLAWVDDNEQEIDEVPDGFEYDDKAGCYVKREGW